MENNKLELKIQALRTGFANKLASIVAEYEDTLAEYRVEYSIMQEQLQNAQNEAAMLREAVSKQNEETTEERPPFD